MGPQYSHEEPCSQRSRYPECGSFRCELFTGWVDPVVAPFFHSRSSCDGNMQNRRNEEWMRNGVDVRIERNEKMNGSAPLGKKRGDRGKSE